MFRFFSLRDHFHTNTGKHLRTPDGLPDENTAASAGAHAHYHQDCTLPLLLHLVFYPQ